MFGKKSKGAKPLNKSLGKSSTSEYERNPMPVIKGEIRYGANSPDRKLERDINEKILEHDSKDD